MPLWIPVTVALSLLVIALSFVGIALAILLTLRALRGEIIPVLKLIRREGEGVAETTKRIRESVDGGMGRIEERLGDLDALYEVLYGEMKETGLEAGVMMRRLRRPGGWWGRMRRLIG